MVFNRKRKDNRSPSFLLDDSPKRTKVQAQRKFAQGSNVNSPVLTPVQELERQEKVMPEPIELLPMKRPNTEDFLTFLCFRGTPVLPPSLNFFNNASMIDTRTQTNETASTSPKNGVLLPSISKSQSGERPFIAFGVRKRADPIVVSRHMDKKRRHALALQALRRKYQEQKMAKIRAITISKLSEKVQTNKTVVRTTRSITKTGTITKKDIAQKTKITVVAKRVKVTTRRTSTLKQPVRSNLKQKMCLRSYRGRFVQRELVNKPVKKRLVHTVTKKVKNIPLETEMEENDEGNVEEAEEEAAEADFSSDDDKPLVKRKVIPRRTSVVRTRNATETRLTRSHVAANQVKPRRIPVHNRIALRTQNALKSPLNSPRLRTQLQHQRNLKVLRSKQEARMPVTRKKIAVTKKIEIKQKTIAKQVHDKGITRVVRKVLKPKITEELSKVVEEEKRELRRSLPSRTTQAGPSTRSENRNTRLINRRLLNRIELNKTSVTVRKVLPKRQLINKATSKVPDNERKCKSTVVEKKPREEKQKNFNQEKRITRETTKLIDEKHEKVNASVHNDTAGKDSRRTTRNKEEKEKANVANNTDNEKRTSRESSKLSKATDISASNKPIVQEKRARDTSKNLEEAEGKHKPIVNTKLSSKKDTVNHDISGGTPLKKTGKVAEDVIDGKQDKTVKIEKITTVSKTLQDTDVIKSPPLTNPDNIKESPIEIIKESSKEIVNKEINVSPKSLVKSIEVEESKREEPDGENIKPSGTPETSENIVEELVTTPNIQPQKNQIEDDSKLSETAEKQQFKLAAEVSSSSDSPEKEQKLKHDKKCSPKSRDSSKSKESKRLTKEVPKQIKEILKQMKEELPKQTKRCSREPHKQDHIRKQSSKHDSSRKSKDNLKSSKKEPTKEDMKLENLIVKEVEKMKIVDLPKIENPKMKSVEVKTLDCSCNTEESLNEKQSDLVILSSKTVPINKAAEEDQNILTKSLKQESEPKEDVQLKHIGIVKEENVCFVYKIGTEQHVDTKDKYDLKLEAVQEVFTKVAEEPPIPSKTPSEVGPYESLIYNQIEIISDPSIQNELDWKCNTLRSPTNDESRTSSPKLVIETLEELDEDDINLQKLKEEEEQRKTELIREEIRRKETEMKLALIEEAMRHQAMADEAARKQELLETARKQHDAELEEARARQALLERLKTAAEQDELKLRHEERTVAAVIVATESLAKLESDGCDKKMEVENVVLVVESKKEDKKLSDIRPKQADVNKKVVESKGITQGAESEVRKCRPTRKTKEAASIYMEILGHKLNQENEDIDDVSIDSFPELPNVRKTEQRENELKAIAKKGTEVTRSKSEEKVPTVCDEKPKEGDNDEKKESKTKPGNSSDCESLLGLKKRNISESDSVQKKSPRKSDAKRNKTSKNSKPTTESMCGSDESFTAEITLPTEKSVRPSRNKSPKLYKSFSDTDTDEDLLIVQKPVKRKSKEKDGCSVKKKAKHIPLTAEQDSFSESDEEPLVKLAQKREEPAKKRPAKKFDGEIIVGKQKRECAKRPQNYLASFPSSDEDDKYFHGFVKSDMPAKAKAVEPSIDLFCKDVGRRYGKEKVNMSNEQIEKWLNDSVLAGMNVIKKENDEMLKFGEKIPTETSLDSNIASINTNNLKNSLLKPDNKEENKDVSQNSTPEKYQQSPNKPIVNEQKKTIFKKERTKPLANINAFSVCNESSVYAFEADNEDSISTPFRRPSRRPSSTATSRSEDDSRLDPEQKGKFRLPSNIIKLDAKHKQEASLSTDESNHSTHALFESQEQLKQGLKADPKQNKLVTPSTVKPLATSSPMFPPCNTTVKKDKASRASCSRSFDRMSETSEDFKYKVPSSPSASSSSSAKLTKSAKQGKSKSKAHEMYAPLKVTDFPSVISPAQIVEAPTYYPNEKEFVDPMEYIEKIRLKAERFGICRIVPPANFKPECKVLDEMRFTAYNQYVHKMMHRWGPNFRELVAIRKYLATQSISLKHPPWIGGMEIDLPRLYQTVQQLGGLKEVIEKKKWPRVSDLMKIPKSAQDRVTKLDDIYCKYLLPYDTLSPDERDKLFDAVETEWAKRESRNLLKAQQDQCTAAASSNKKPEEEENESEDEDETDVECILKGRNMALSAFYRIARNTMSMWFRSNEPSAQEVEEEFWKHVTMKQYHICVHSGSIDSGSWGYGFAVSKNSPFARHAWNLKVLTNNSGSILRSMGPVMGLTVPTLHVGMVFSGCCWYRDPHSLPWIEYLHTGANKIWYGIPDSMSEKFHSTLLKLVPNYCLNKTLWLPSDTAMLPPNLLVDNGVSLARTVQEPGQFVVIFPKAFTSNICTGYVVSESVFFASPSWLNRAENVFTQLRNCCEPSMFSYERLLLSIVADPRSDVSVLNQIIPAVHKLCEREIGERSKLKELGVCAEEKLPLPDVKKKKKMMETDIEYACEDCRWNLFCSMIYESLENSFYCLEHAIGHLEAKRIDSKNCKLFYTYDCAELLMLVGRLKATIEAKMQKKATGGKFAGLPTLLNR